MYDELFTVRSRSNHSAPKMWVLTDLQLDYYCSGALFDELRTVGIDKA